MKTILVDVGKTMRDAVLRVFPKIGVQHVNSILITHGHADAMLGLDDVRDLQTVEHVYDAEGNILGYRPVSGPLRVITNKTTMDRLHEAFPYLARKTEEVPGHPGVYLRRTAVLQWETVGDWAELKLDGGIQTKIFPVYHGGTYVSLAFMFGPPGEFVYISDVKNFPKKSQDMLDGLPQIQVLCIDCLQIEKHTTHFCYDEAVDYARKMKAKVTYFVGMSCWVGMHSKVQQMLDEIKRKEGIDIRLARDGLTLDPISF